jgi:hypothetical protein
MSVHDSGPGTYQGKPITIVRKAEQGARWCDAKKDQVVIMKDGKEQTVNRADVA